jgi:hypothetical protein
MAIRSSLGNEESGGDLAIGEALRDHARDLDLAWT